jgi:hypothetical protein
VGQRRAYRSLTVAALIWTLAAVPAFAAQGSGVAAGAVIDRIAVVVGNNTVITETEVLREVRLTEFMNQQPLDLGPQPRRAAAERLVDQQLIRNEMSIGTYPTPAASEAGEMLRRLLQERFPAEAQYQAALEKYGITQADLEQHLLWELAALRFTDVRFGGEKAPLPDGEPQSANRVKEGTAVDQQMEEWLKQARSTTRVQFKAGAFQ